MNAATNALLRTALAGLAKDLPLCNQLVYKNANQHRRTRPFRAFRGIVKLAAGLAAAGAALDSGRGCNDARRLASLHSDAAHCVTRCVDLARVLTEHQVGAGFAGTMAVLVALAAQLVQEAARVRDATTTGAAAATTPL